MIKGPTLLSTDKKTTKKDFINSELNPKDKKNPNLRKSYVDKASMFKKNEEKKKDTLL